MLGLRAGAGAEVWGFSSGVMQFTSHMHSLHILAYIYTNKNLLYTAGVSRILNWFASVLANGVGPCSYKSKEACNLSEYKAKCFILSTGCQHILIWYISGIRISHTKHIFDQKK